MWGVINLDSDIEIFISEEDKRRILRDEFIEGKMVSYKDKKKVVYDCLLGTAESCEDASSILVQELNGTYTVLLAPAVSESLITYGAVSRTFQSPNRCEVQGKIQSNIISVVDETIHGTDLNRDFVMELEGLLKN